VTSSITRAGAPKTSRKLACNFAALSLAEMACRAISVAVTLNLAKRLGTEGYGRVEFAFNLVCWLVLLVREGMDVIAAREIARHPRLARPLAGLVLAMRLLIACVLWSMLATASWMLGAGGIQRSILLIYGLLLITTSLGLDFVYRGLERMGVVALSMCIRTGVYASCVALLVTNSSQILLVPVLLVAGEAFGIALVWLLFTREFGLPRPSLRRGRFLGVFLKRGRMIYLIQVSQAAVIAIDIVVVGMMSGWHDVGIYSASHRMVAAVLTFGLIFQQVAFPTLARCWRASPEAGRRALDGFVRILSLAFVPVAVGTTVLSGPLVTWLLGANYSEAGPVLALEVWRAPLLSVAFLYQSALIALNRESVGVRVLLAGALASIPLTVALRSAFGLNGAAAASVITALLLAWTGYQRLRWEGRQPAWHHQLAKPVLAALAMTLACLSLVRWHVALAIAGGGLVYLTVIFALGGLRREELLALLGQRSPQPVTYSNTSTLQRVDNS
jgi:O-antigen/teichoic acid export membrane protein